MATDLYPPAPNPIAEDRNLLVTRPWLAFFQRVAQAAMQLLTGDVTSTSSGVTTITNNVVTVAKLQQIPSLRLLGRLTSGTGNVEILTIGTGFSESGTTLNALGAGNAYVPVSTGAEPLLIVSNGAGSVLLTPYTYSQ